MGQRHSAAVQMAAERFTASRRERARSSRRIAHSRRALVEPVQEPGSLVAEPNSSPRSRLSRCRAWPGFAACDAVRRAGLLGPTRDGVPTETMRRIIGYASPALNLGAVKSLLAGHTAEVEATVTRGGHPAPSHHEARSCGWPLSALDSSLLEFGSVSCSVAVLALEDRHPDPPRSGQRGRPL